MSQPFIEFLEGLQTRDTAEEFKRAKASSRQEKSKQGNDQFSNPDICSTISPLRKASHERFPSKESASFQEEQPQWDEVKRSSRLGPLLSTLRAEHEKQPAALRESYSIEHLKRLYQFVPRRAYEKPRSSELCSKVHPNPCPYGCKSCHFCRQRTTEIKTVCSVCEGVNNYYGGPARGYWCGSCLWLRIGENIDEVREMSDWVCPGCRDVCNCSGANCMRIKRGWFPTQQLSHEAREQGYKSVAHYLVLTHLNDTCNAAPQVMPRTSSARRQTGHTARRNHRTSSPVEQRKRPGELVFEGQISRRQKLENVSKLRLQTEVTAILKDMDSFPKLEVFDKGLSGNSSPIMEKLPRVMSDFLCILDKDIKESDESLEQENMISFVPGSSKLFDIANVNGNTLHAAARRDRGSPVPLEEWQIPKELMSTNERSSSKFAHSLIGHYNETESNRTDNKGIIREFRTKNNNMEGANLDVLHKVSVGKLHTIHEKNGNKSDSNHARGEHQVQVLDTLHPKSKYNVDEEFIPVQTDTDEFIWNNLCIRAASILESIRTFHKLSRKSRNDYSGRLEIDEKTYQAIFDKSLPMLQAILNCVEGLILEDFCIFYSERLPSSSLKTSKIVPGSLRTIGGLKRSIQLLTFLSRLLPINDIRWRIERRLMGFEPFVNFEASSPHAKAILLKGRIEFAVILQRRGLANHQVLATIGESLALIALDMQRLLPYLDAILKDRPLPGRNEAISGWHYDHEIRKKKIVEIFADLSALYASLQGVLLASLSNLIDLCDILGVKSHYILTENFISRLLSRECVYPCIVTREVLQLICRILCAARRPPLINDECGMTIEDQNFFFQESENLVGKVRSLILPNVESLVQEEYRMWGSNKDLQWFKDDEILQSNTKERVGSEKVEVVARCYALLVQKGIMTWNTVETRATAPYSFKQFWRHANVTYRHFAVYLLSHTIHNIPTVLDEDKSLPRILHVWLLSILDYGKHQCSWYLTLILSQHLTEIFPSKMDPDYNFLNDLSGLRRAALLKRVGSALVLSPIKFVIFDMIHDVDQFLFERQKEIIRTAVNSENTLPLWQKSVGRAVIGLLHGLMPLQSITDDSRQEFQKLLNLCSFWIVESCYQLRSRLPGLQSDLGQSSGSCKEQATSAAGIRQYLEDSTFSIIHDAIPLIESLRLRCSSEQNKEYLEPLWIIISGCIEFGEAGLEMKEYEHAIYDRIAASIVSSPEMGASRGVVAPSNASGFPLQIFVLATFVRRYLWRATYRHSIHESHAINALRLALAIMSRSEMRSKSMFEAAFNTMIPMCLYVLMRAADQELLSFRNAMFRFFSFCVKQQGSVVPCKLEADISPTIRLWQSFWECICRECLSVVTSRFPAEIHSAVSVDAEILHSKLLLSTPDLALFLPSTPESLADIYNLALSLIDLPFNFQSFEELICQINVSESPQLGPSHGHDFPTRQLLQRPGNLSWMVAKTAISLLIDISDVEFGNTEPSHENLCGKEHARILKYSLASLPYLWALINRGGNASMLIEKDYVNFIDRLKRIYPTLQSYLNESLNADGPDLVGKQLFKGSQVVRNMADMSRLEVGATFEFVGHLSKIRRIERKGVQVVVCSLSTANWSAGNASGTLYTPSGISDVCLNLLVSKPKSLLDMLLGLENKLDRSINIKIENIELVRKSRIDHQHSEQIAVARALSCTKIMVSKPEPSREQEENPIKKGNGDIFSHALGHLTSMGYERKASEDVLIRIRDSGDSTRADAASIVARAVEILVQGL